MAKNIILFLLLSLFSLSGMSQSFMGKQKLIDPNRSSLERLGFQVASAGDYLILSSPEANRDTNGLNPFSSAGLVVIYKKNVFGGYNYHQTLQSAHRNTVGQFGWSMAAQDSILVVGARGEDIGQFKNGAAYVFKLQNGWWVQSQRLLSNDTAFNARYGSSVAISGNTIVIGAEQNPTDSAGNNFSGGAGAAYVYDYQNGSWLLSEKLSASVRSGARFGTGVAINGNSIMVSAPLELYSIPNSTLFYRGVMYAFERNALGDWNENQRLLDTAVTGASNLGDAMAWSDSILIVSSHQKFYANTVGAGVAFYLGKNQNGFWQLKQIISSPAPFNNDEFGTSLTLEGGNLIVGVPLEDHDENEQNPLTGSGAAYWYELDPQSDQFIFKQKILPNDRSNPESTGDFFGMDVHLKNNILLIGAPYDGHDTVNLNFISNAGAAYLFDTICSNTPTLARDTICFGTNYFFGGQSLNSSGVYQNTFTTAMGCDSAVTLYLEVHPQIKDTLHIDACRRFYLLGRGINVYSSGIYEDTLQSANGCDSILSYNLSIIIINADVRPVNTHQARATTQNATYQWLDCLDGLTPVPGATNDTLTAPYNGVFAVAVTRNGCTDTSQCIIISGVSLQEHYLTKLRAYPNPAIKILQFNRHLKSGQIVDQQGRVVLQVSGWTADISALAAGMYFLKVDHESLKILIGD
jgi:hypothetical protein